jgi:hypothetical protein
MVIMYPVGQFKPSSSSKEEYPTAWKGESVAGTRFEDDMSACTIVKLCAAIFHEDDETLNLVAN